MRRIARLATTSVMLTYLHLVFGGIVRISGSGMGCGDHWPKCNGSWVPPFDSPIVMIEWTHRLLAALVTVAIAWLALETRRQRDIRGVSGPGGVQRPAAWSLALVIAVALLGMVTVKLGNRPIATVAHWTLAMTLLALVSATAVRAVAFGGTVARSQGGGGEGGSARAVRSLGAAAALAFVAVVLGGLVAKFPGASVACRGFPLCGAPPDTSAAAVGLQLAHRVVAYLLFFHVIAVSLAISRRRGESDVVRRAAKIASALVLLQLGVGAAMVLSLLPPVLRSAHEAIGIAVWLTLFLAAYLARAAAGRAEYADSSIQRPVSGGVMSPVSHA